jgi:hypothetical protein
MMIPKAPRFQTMLEDGYQPQPFDVICTRHKESAAHPGNVRFRICVEMRLDRYLAAKTRREKTTIVKEIIDAVRASGGRFIKQNDVTPTGKLQNGMKGTATVALTNSNTKRVYVDVGNRKAADKISHALRFASLAREANTRRKSWSCGTSMMSNENNQNLFADESCEGTFQVDMMIDIQRNFDVITACSLEFERMRQMQEHQMMMVPFLSAVNMGANAMIGNAHRMAFPTWETTAMRRQSWHAGVLLPDMNFGNVANILDVVSDLEDESDADAGSVETFGVETFPKLLIHEQVKDMEPLDVFSDFLTMDRDDNDDDMTNDDLSRDHSLF